ncbi:hypothetical protein ACCUM_3221 [Candidatus Accumulibacter phosphatis]|uniref:Uncharacterized protein n=1 Tax=Candidatus Accumulibacter phosphatis TaxID=327160 RepID=A0A5S4EPK8_9PROT|nr:hypothetical protein ACCUM_3221 [Candidatus Accumulibacter phosphatis]
MLPENGQPITVLKRVQTLKTLLTRSPHRFLRWHRSSTEGAHAE